MIVSSRPILAAVSTDPIIIHETKNVTKVAITRQLSALTILLLCDSIIIPIPVSL